MVPNARIIRGTLESRIGITAFGLVIAVLATLPQWGTSSNMTTVVGIMALLSLAQMWNLLAGFGGMVSIGQQMFIGLGAYGLLVIAEDIGVDPFLSVPLVGAVVAVASVPIALAAFRLRGGYFAIGTWVLADVVLLIVLNNSALGGGNGRSLLSLGDYDRIAREDLTFYLSLLIGVGSVALVVFILRSRLGLALRSVRDHEDGARALGVDVFRAKLVVWVLAAGWTGMTGALIYIDNARVQPTAAFSVEWTAFMIFIVVIGGVGSTTGPILGTLVFWVLREQLQGYNEWALIVLGAIAVVMAVLAPKGLYGLMQRVRPVQFFPVRRRLIIDDRPS